jgi:hypothetical protein
MIPRIGVANEVSLQAIDRKCRGFNAWRMPANTTTIEEVRRTLYVHAGLLVAQGGNEPPTRGFSESQTLRKKTDTRSIS